MVVVKVWVLEKSWLLQIHIHKWFEMLLFWNSIFGQSSYSELKIKKKKKKFKSTFAIIRCSKNQVLHLKLDF